MCPVHSVYLSYYFFFFLILFQLSSQHNGCDRHTAAARRLDHIVVLFRTLPECQTSFCNLRCTLIGFRGEARACLNTDTIRQQDKRSGHRRVCPKTIAPRGPVRPLHPSCCFLDRARSPCGSSDRTTERISIRNRNRSFRETQKTKDKNLLTTLSTYHRQHFLRRRRRGTLLRQYNSSARINCRAHCFR